MCMLYCMYIDNINIYKNSYTKKERKIKYTTDTYHKTLNDSAAGAFICTFIVLARENKSKTP